MPKAILVADDSASIRLAVRMLLENRREKLVIREAFDGTDAIKKARKLLEVAMPKLNRAFDPAKSPTLDEV